jgi:hypothetical protein
MAGMAATTSIAKSAANKINFLTVYLLFRFTLLSTARWAHAASVSDSYLYSYLLCDLTHETQHSQPQSALFSAMKQILNKSPFKQTSIKCHLKSAGIRGVSGFAAWVSPL